MVSRSCSCMWQSQIEIKDHSVAYFDCIVVFEAPYSLRAVLMCKLIRYSHIYEAPPLMEAQQCGALNMVM